MKFFTVCSLEIQKSFTFIDSEISKTNTKEIDFFSVSILSIIFTFAKSKAKQKIEREIRKFLKIKIFEFVLKIFFKSEKAPKIGFFWDFLYKK